MINMINMACSSSTTSAHRCCCDHHLTRPRQQLCRVSAQDVVQMVSDATAMSDAHMAAAAASLPVLADLQPGIAVAAGVPDPPITPSTYTPGPVEVGWQIWFAAFVSTVPFVIGAYEFGKRILIQRRCKVCGGNGLVQRGRFQRKCPECGGFFPWISWSMFLSANARPGNGGPLLQPRGQTSVFYSVPPAEAQQGGSTSSTHQGSGTSSTQQQSRTDADEATTVGAQQNKGEQQEGS